MITAELLHARAAPLALTAVTTKLGAGVHALLGARSDGGVLFMALVAARARKKSGSLRVLDGDPSRPEVRRAIGDVPIDVALPEVLRVDEALNLASDVRGEPRTDSVATLARLGVEDLASRRVQSLAREEARAVAMCEALGSRAVRVVLIEEPFASLDPRAAARLPDALRSRARDGACIVVTTASVREAIDLGDDILTFDRGALVRHAVATDPLAISRGGGVNVRALVDHPHALAAALEGEPDVSEVHVDATHGAVTVRGSDPRSAASAIARAVLRTDVVLEWLGVDAAPLVDVHAAIAHALVTADASRGVGARSNGASSLPPSSLGKPPAPSTPPARPPPDPGDTP